MWHDNPHSRYQDDQPSPTTLFFSSDTRGRVLLLRRVSCSIYDRRPGGDPALRVVRSVVQLVCMATGGVLRSVRVSWTQRLATPLKKRR